MYNKYKEIKIMANEEETLLTAAEAFAVSQDIVEGRAAIKAKIEKAAAEGKFSVVGFPAPVVIDELRAKGYSVDDMTNFGKIQGYEISWKNGLVENIGSYEDGENTFADETKELVLTGTIPAQAKVIAKGKAVTLKGVKVEAAVINATAAEDFEMTGATITGVYDKASQGNAMASVHADGKVEIKNTTFEATGYNGIEIGLTTGLAKEVNISNCEFKGKVSNNAISIFGTADDAVVNIENCRFEEVSNVLRISNRTNVKCTINFINCVVDKWETGAYAGCVLCQDYTGNPKGADNLFGDGKIKINFFNLTGPNGVIKGKMAEDVCATADENQLVYVYTDKVEEYEASKYPVVKVY